MNDRQIVQAGAKVDATGALLLSTGLAFASLILVPALAAELGLGSSLTSALRMALMKASNRVIGKSAKSVPQQLRRR